MKVTITVGSVLLLICLALSFGMAYAESAATEDVNATLSNNTTNESVSFPQNATNVTISDNSTQNAANPFANAKGALSNRE